MIEDVRNLRLRNWLRVASSGAHEPILSLEQGQNSVIINGSSPNFYEGIVITEKIIESAGFVFYEYELVDNEELSKELPQGYTIGEGEDTLFMWYRKFKNDLVYFGIEFHPSGNHCLFKTNHYHHRSDRENDMDMSVMGYFKYVHELQNLYYLCFQDELEIVFTNK